jgi:hypothetical protein
MSKIEESFACRINNALGLNEDGAGATHKPTFGPVGVTKGSTTDDKTELTKRKKKKRKAAKVEDEVLGAG